MRSWRGSLHDFESKNLIHLAFFISLIGRIVVILLLGQEQHLYEYGGIARNLVSGNGFSLDMFPPATPVQETCVMSPFYPYLLAMCYFLFGVNTTAIAALQLIQSVVGATTVYPLFHLAKDYFTRRTAILSVFLFAVFPDFLHWSYLIQQLTFTTFFTVCVVYLFHIFNKDPSVRKATAFGFTAGIGLLVDAVIITILGLFLVWTLYVLIREWFVNGRSVSVDVRRKGIGVLLAVVVCGAIIAPWEYRCLNVYDGHFVFIKASGFNLWRGNNPNYTETGIPPWVTTNLLLDLNLTKEGDIDAALGQLALKYMANHPFETITNTGRKFIEFWWFPKAYPNESPILRQIIYTPLFLLALLTIFMKRNRLFNLAPLILPLIAFSLLYSVIFVLSHHRIPIQPILFILSARGVDYLSSKIYASIGETNSFKEPRFVSINF